ncbi:hypothetical protein [Tautonia sociabilis]|uniref:Uncharacterized protein n=1 Tax=Tautonia sociabilis TaxID=2080755 RepID=A0A432MP42_9BACT|nr:hypothetical protein [Tautonia sociabilis]RUL89223.1 hypothetical protein TsocGM_03660 [Tautonia sociabilis]
MAIVICKCGSWLRAPDPEEGGQGRCPSCGRVIGPDGTVSDEPGPPPRSGGFFRRLAGPRRPSPSFPKRGRPIGVGEALAFPVSDGPGLMLLTLFPPFMTFMSVPVFDVVLLFRDGPRGGFNPLALLLLPFAMPLILCFIFTSGYIMLYLARVLTDGAMGRAGHPNFPIWDRHTILEGLARWIWAGVVGLGVGALPVLLYVKLRGEFGPLDWAAVSVLIGLAAGYVQMGLAASLLQDDLTLAHPVAIARAVRVIGREYVPAWMMTAAALFLAVMAWRFAMTHSPGNLKVAALELWGFWVLVLYEAMLIMHVLGRTIYRNAAGLGWYRREPKWSSWERPGRIYTNS